MGRAYTVTMNSPEAAEFLADRQGNAFHLTADGSTLAFDESAHAWFAERPSDDDGHIDSDGSLWFNGIPYPVVGA